MTGRLRDLVLAILVGVLAAGAGAFGWDALRDARTPDPAPVGDRVQQAADAFNAGQHVYVAADSHDRIPPADAARLEALAAEANLPVRIAVWEHSAQGGYGNSTYNAVRQLARLVDGDGVHVLVTGPGKGIVMDTYRGRIDPEIPDDLNGDQVRRLEEIIAVASTATAPTASTWDYWGGPGGAIAAGLLMSIVSIPVTLLLIGLGRLVAGRRFRAPGGWW